MMRIVIWWCFLMKLIQIYSNNNDFNNIIFKNLNGINVIYGSVVEKDENVDTHNLGKSILIEIIDFLLLKEIDNKHFLKQKYDNGKLVFDGYIFYVELLLNSGSYLTIKRSVNKNTKISFKRHSEGYQNFVSEEQWDIEDYPLTRNGDDSPKAILNTLLGFDVLDNFKYRKSLSFFLRTQNDYSNVFKASKYRGPDIDWKPMVYRILGFDDEKVIKKYNAEKEYEHYKKEIEILQKEKNISIDDLEQKKELLRLQEIKGQELKEQIDNFNFYSKENSINEDLIVNIENNISEKNNMKYKLSYEINQIQQSLASVENPLNLDDVESLYSDANIYFSDQLKKDYNQLVAFNNKITRERNKYLKLALENKLQVLNTTNTELEILDTKRCEALRWLNEQDSFEKFKHYQSELVEVETSINILMNKIESIKFLAEKADTLKDLEDNVTEAVSALKIEEDTKDSNDTFLELKNKFNEFVKFVIDKSVILTTYINQSNNIEFNIEIASDDLMSTSQSKGHSYKQLLCACFDLAILVTYHDKSYYKFVYHDGVLESLDHRPMVKFIELVRKVSKEYNIQYIMTAIDHTLAEEIVFSNNEIAVKLDDRKDDSGRLFGFQF